jgi:short-subunit dehydrogenase
VARSASKLNQLAGELGDPTRVLAVPTDVTDQAAVERMAAQVLGHFGKIDVIINSAGYGVFDPVAKLPATDVAGMIDVNLIGALRCTQAVLPHMQKRRAGQVVVLASIAGLLPFRNMGGYSASKFAMLGLFQTLQLELAGTGVRCAILCPGPSKTNFMDGIDLAKYPRITRMLPWITPERVADEIVQAVARRAGGRIVIPRLTLPLVIFGQAFPRLARLVMQLVG